MKAIKGAKLEEVVGGLNLKTMAKLTLIAICNRADSSGKMSEINIGSGEAGRLVPDLHQIGVGFVSGVLGRTIEIANGVMKISPFDKKLLKEQEVPEQENEQLAQAV